MKELEGRIIDKPQWLIELEAQPCQCVPCEDCDGTGTIWDYYQGVEEPEGCTSCDGGLVEICDRCQELDEYYEETP